MKISNLFILIKCCDKLRLPYDFYISKYPIIINNCNHVTIGSANDINLYKTNLYQAKNFCNILSLSNLLEPIYKEDLINYIDINSIRDKSFRLPTPIKWDYAAH